MSITLVRSVLETNLPTSTKLVAVCLAEHVNEKAGTRKAFPALETMQRECSLSRRFVQIALADLVSTGLVTRAFEGVKAPVFTFAHPDDAVWKLDFVTEIKAHKGTIHDKQAERQRCNPRHGKGAIHDKNGVVDCTLTRREPELEPVDDCSDVEIVAHASASDKVCVDHADDHFEHSEPAGPDRFEQGGSLIDIHPATSDPQRDQPHRMPAQWQPGPLPANVAELVAQWPPGAEQIQLDEFREYWIDATSNALKLDWQRTWINRIRSQHQRVMTAAQSHSNQGFHNERHHQRQSVRDELSSLYFELLDEQNARDPAQQILLAN
jgi:hypothetical protein